MSNDKWVSVEDLKQLPYAPDGIDWSIEVVAKCGNIKRRAYYDFFLGKWFWIKKDETTTVIYPTHYLLPQPPKQ